VLCDVDQVPIYPGQSVDGIRSRVNRHLTSARHHRLSSERRLGDRWVWAYPAKDKAEIGVLEDELFHAFNAKSAFDERQGSKIASVSS
jgi:hypothetical protein